MTLTKREDTIGSMCFFAALAIGMVLLMAFWFDKTIVLGIVNIGAAIGLIGFIAMYLKFRKISKEST